MLLTELPASGEIPMLVAGIVRGDTACIQTARRGSCPLRELAANSEVVMVFDERIAGNINDSIAALWKEIPSGKTAFIPLVPRAAAPQIGSSYCEPISSFLCSSDVFARFLDSGVGYSARSLCFAVLREIADGALEVDRLLVRQIPFLQRLVYGRDALAKALILPHRGDPAFLCSTLKYIGRSAGNPPTVRVGLDVGDSTKYGAFPEEHPDVEFFDFSPAPVGPYVIRQELAERSPEPLLTLQDSDDLSCYDRFVALGDALAQTGCGIVGSHELCLDELRWLVQPVRFPLDCCAALALRANHALLHATLMTHRSAFFNTGGLSTHLIIANDTQFLLRAYFNTSIRNVDEFLYIRRRHPVSLTNAPETVVDNPLRRRLNWEWTRDFEAIGRGELKMEDSTLRPMHRTDAYKVERLRPA